MLWHTPIRCSGPLSRPLVLVLMLALSGKENCFLTGIIREVLRLDRSLEQIDCDRKERKLKLWSSSMWWSLCDK